MYIYIHICVVNEATKSDAQRVPKTILMHDVSGMDPSSGVCFHLKIGPYPKRNAFNYN